MQYNIKNKSVMTLSIYILFHLLTLDIAYSYFTGTYPSVNSNAYIMKSVTLMALNDDNKIVNKISPPKMKRNNNELIDMEDAIYYPKIKEIADNEENLSEDDILYNMFLTQIANMNSNDEDKFGNDVETTLLKPSRKNKMTSIISDKKIVEESIIIEKETPLEIIYNKRISFANFISKKPGSKNGIFVRLVTGEIVTIDVGQIISSWDIIADENNVESTGDWAEVAADALAILGSMSSRKSDLVDFWTKLSRRSSSLPVDSLDLGVYVFQESRFRAWIDPYTSADISGVQVLSAAQRYVCALILFYDDFHFKRKPSVLVDMTVDGNHEQLDNGDSICIIEGGYKVLDEGSARQKEGEVFLKYFNERLEKIKQEEASSTGTSTITSDVSSSSIASEPFRKGSISRQLRLLELYSMSPPNLPPNTDVRSLLRLFDVPLSPEGAKNIIDRLRIKVSPTTVKGKDKEKGTERVFESFTPWSPDELQAANELHKYCNARRQEISLSTVMKVGKRSVDGRMDFRGNMNEHPALCIDAKNAAFLDDAFSLFPETGEILVHVVDVAATLRKSEVLQQTAKARVSSIFLPTGPLHMLPAQALDALKLSSTHPNEVITVALSVDAASGKVLGYRIFPSIIGPVTLLDVDTADEILSGVGVGDIDKIGKEFSNRLGYTDAAIRDLLRTRRLLSKVTSIQPWADGSFSNREIVRQTVNKRTGNYDHNFVKKTPANQIVNTLLTLYSNASTEYCASKNLSTPIAWMNRDKVESFRVTRFATQPLRNWISQLQQYQLRAALRMNVPLSKRDCALAVSHHNAKRIPTAALNDRGKDQMKFESFEAQCATLYEAGAMPIFTAEGIGRGGIVHILPLKIQGVVNTAVTKGEKIQVQVKKIIPHSKTIILDVI